MNNLMAESEWSLMRVLWTISSATSKQLTNIMFQKKEWSSSTTKTILKRLQDKGLVTHNGENRNRIYTPCVEEKVMMASNLSNLLHDMCSMKVGDSLVTALTKCELSQTDIKNLINLLQEKAIKAPKTIACDCLPEHCHMNCD
ncbi:CopY/TcrY family copper transport repressor [Weissella beninensis]|uniref:BlaI/MecI/CopY family transcriptional regulator n=1 Tax=Periweissella beninensis TaxID=504936 RepID=A0ABT0VFB6_9LACO|nr:BlaI/MecI/CopY family transcriptional regulator [Periweissella beninensis]MBM7543565.1 CopY/TcrY family copper transport repressor [Periweissella beninensis]MCM2436547.1 BlaI/MecI/CopY family transcriptional regulator [Periweissella beninensis]